MKLKFRKEELINGINIVTKAIPGRTTNPILECILFDATEEEISLITNDMDLGIKTSVNGEIEEKGKVAIEARLISDIIRKSENNESEIEIETDTDFNVTIKNDNSLFNIPGRDGDEFPYLTEIEKINFIELSQFTLKEVIRQTVFSAALNDNNKMMGGEYVEVLGTRARFTTLDGHRVAVRNIEMKDSYPENKVVIPVRTLNEVSKIIENDNEKNVKIYFSNNHTLFEIDKTLVLTRVIDGEYFKIGHMLTKDYITKVKVNKNKLISSIDKSMIFIRESDHKPIILNITKNNINVSIKSSFGAMDGDIECDKEGNDLKIAFNPKFLIDALKAIDDEEVNLYFTNAKSPCFIRDDEEKYNYLILPVNFIE